jgi:flavin reductase (DIM6/NTAB) family NADH-FMN oxidoreductase RutF
VEYDAVLAAIDTPVVVVTTAAGAARAGCLVAFDTPCSIDPPRYAIWLSRTNHTTAVVGHAQRLAVHVLSRRQHQLAELFGARSGWHEDKFTTCAWREVDDVPVLCEAPAWFAGRIVERMPCGDHVLVVVEPRMALGSADDCLRLSDVRHLRPGNPP